MPSSPPLGEDELKFQAIRLVHEGAFSFGRIYLATSKFAARFRAG
ncbi:MAG: hypothetical protein JWL97_4334 [Gemmatimonadales bacterium]|nr:hypothetical protein [Gemmatimonadales bacterium]